MSIKIVGKRLGFGGVVCSLLLGALGLVGCQTQSPQQPQQFAEVPPDLVAASSAAPVAAPTTASAPATVPAANPAAAPAAGPGVIPVLTNNSGLQAAVLRVGDSLTITFTDTPIPIPVFDEKIREDGTITLTLNKSFKAAGMTASELEKEIRKCYVPDYYKYMTVTVKPDVSTQWYYVDGEVSSRGSRQIYNSRITVLKAIASAGGFTDFANKKKVKLTRVDGRSQTVNCVKALDNPSLDPEVYPGDKIHVPRRLW